MAYAKNSGAWTYAVPLEEIDGNARPYYAHDGHYADDDARSPEKHSSAWDLMSDSEATKQRRTSLRASNVAQQTARKRSRNQLRDNRQEQKAEGGVDDSAWIHRDKLAAIEIQEMHEAGIYVRKSRRSESAGPLQDEERASRSVSRSGVKRPSSRTKREASVEPGDVDYDYYAPYSSQVEPSRKRISTVPSGPEDEHDFDEDHEPDQYQNLQHPTREYDPYNDASFRPNLTAKQQTSRPGTSRIPVSRVSPVPVPQTVVDRDSPLPRSRAGSQNWGGSFDEMQYQRRLRSGSVGSQVLLDSDPITTRQGMADAYSKTSSNEDGSPVKRNVKDGSLSGPKSTSPSAMGNRPGSSHQQGKRAGSTSASRRPGSSSAHKSRPSTGHLAPEGEAPWIATMWKPDPRLPPDQQMLPTHAKRMMQEQWERDGKTGTAYDRDFRLLNNDELPRPNATSTVYQTTDPESTIRSPSPTKKDLPSPSGSLPNPWPSSPTKSDTRSDHNGRPGTSGGYKITPTIAQTPTMQRSPLPSPGIAPSMSQHQSTFRMPELDEKQEEPTKKGCCCVVM